MAAASEASHFRRLLRIGVKGAVVPTGAGVVALVFAFGRARRIQLGQLLTDGLVAMSVLSLGSVLVAVLAAEITRRLLPFTAKCARHRILVCALIPVAIATAVLVGLKFRYWGLGPEDYGGLALAAWTGAILEIAERGANRGDRTREDTGPSVEGASIRRHLFRLPALLAASLAWFAVTPGRFPVADQWMPTPIWQFALPVAIAATLLALFPSWPSHLLFCALAALEVGLALENLYYPMRIDSAGPAEALRITGGFLVVSVLVGTWARLPIGVRPDCPSRMAWLACTVPLGIYWGWRGLAIREHAEDAGALLAFGAVTLVALRRRPLLRQIALPWIAVTIVLPAISLVTGQCLFLRKIRPTERYLERLIPEVEEFRRRTGSYPESRPIPCGPDLPAMLALHCRDGVVPEAYSYAGDRFVLGFDPRIRLYRHSYADWNVRDYVSDHSGWWWALAD